MSKDCEKCNGSGKVEVYVGLATKTTTWKCWGCSERGKQKDKTETPEECAEEDIQKALKKFKEAGGVVTELPENE